MLRPRPRVGAGVPRAGRAAAALCGLALGACHGATARRAPDPALQAPGGALSVRWHLDVNRRDLFAPRAEECATGVVAAGRLVLGSRAGKVLGIDLDRARVVWSRALGAGVDSEAVLDPETGFVLIGADDGALHALRVNDGRLAWSFQGEGGITQPAVPAGTRVLVATARDKLYALDGRTGAQQWTYDREPPEGFTVHGYAAPAFADGTVYAGFSDGFLVALRAEGGELLWARSLALGAGAYADVDSTPVLAGDLVIASSHSGGLFALSRDDGQVRWRVPVEGAGVQALVDDRLYFYAPRGGLHAADPRTGEILWRHGLERAGEITPPRAAGPYLLFSSARGGLHVVEREGGRQVQVFDPSVGLCAGPALDPGHGMAYLLSNGGRLYALSLAY